MKNAAAQLITEAPVSVYGYDEVFAVRNRFFVCFLYTSLEKIMSPAGYSMWFSGRATPRFFPEWEMLCASTGYTGPHPIVFLLF